MFALSDAQFRAVWATANGLPVEKRGVFQTGCTVHVYEFLGVISYLNSGGPKIAHFWRMQTTRKAAKSLTGDIKAVEWLPLCRAIERLSLPHEQHFLRNVGRHALRKSLVM